MMEKVDSLIEKVTISELFPTMAAKDWARITNTEPDFQSRAFYYRAVHNGEEFQEIVAGFVPPAQKPGFAVVIGLGRQEDPRINPDWNLGTRSIVVMAEVEKNGLMELVQACVELKKKFYPALEKGLYCDYDDSLQFRISQIMASKMFQEEQPFVLLPGLYFEQATSFRDYIATLNLYQKILDRSTCGKLRNHMAEFPREAMVSSEKKAWEEYPAVTALAYAVHGLMVNPMLDSGDGVIEGEE
jgi:hypothetical protein